MFISKNLQGKLKEKSCNKTRIHITFDTIHSKITMTGDFFSICFDSKITLCFALDNKFNPFKILESKSANVIISNNNTHNEYSIDISSLKIEKEIKSFKITLEAYRK